MTVAQDQPMDFRDYMAREQQQAVMRISNAARILGNAGLELAAINAGNWE